MTAPGGERGAIAKRGHCHCRLRDWTRRPSLLDWKGLAPCTQQSRLAPSVLSFTPPMLVVTDTPSMGPSLGFYRAALISKGLTCVGAVVDCP
jgi:hypothetical protein